MKRILIILAAVVAVFTANAQTPDFSAQIAAYNNTCPQTISDGVVLSNVDFVDGSMRFNYHVADVIYQSLDQMKEILRESFVADLMSSSVPLTKTVVTMCKTMNVNICQRFVSESGSEFTLEIKATELN